MISGSCTRARAMATRCCWPPDSVSARWPARRAMSRPSSAERPMAFSESVQSFSSARVGGTWKARPIITLVSTSRRPARLNCWKIIAQRARHCLSARPRKAVTSVSPKRICPAVGSPSRLIMRKSVDLPEPDWPITPRSWPAGTTSDTWSTARLPPKLLITPSNRSIEPLDGSPAWPVPVGCCGKATVWLQNQDVLWGITRRPDPASVWRSPPPCRRPAPPGCVRP